MEIWSFPLPPIVALAVVATLGYLFGRRSRGTDDDLRFRSRRELKRAQAVAGELETIAKTIRNRLATYHGSVSRFKDRLGKLGDKQQQEAAWQELCCEAEEILRPTLSLASQIATAYEEIRQQSARLMSFTEVRTDPLTGLANRRGLDDTLAAQFAMVARYGGQFSLAMFDVDHFKRINDAQGHLYGDRVLQDLAKVFDQCARETDVVARFGGEEFVVVMPQTDLDGACILAERLRSQVEEQMPLTISGGVTTALADDHRDGLLDRADNALYRAKSSGRNCIFRDDGAEIEAFASQTCHIGV